MTTLAKTIAYLFATALLTACSSDPLVGSWESKDDDKIDLDVEAVDEGYEGNGHIYVCSGDACQLCAFEFEAGESGDDSWDIDGKFTGDCSSMGKFEGIECELNDAGDELECEIPGGSTIEYEKKED